MFHAPELVKAKASVKKKGSFKSRERLWIQRRGALCSSMFWAGGCCCVRGRGLVQRLLGLGLAPEADEGTSQCSKLLLLAYCFLLRVPSEALPVRACHKGDVRGLGNASLSREGVDLPLHALWVVAQRAALCKVVTWYWSSSGARTNRRVVA